MQQQTGPTPPEEMPEAEIEAEYTYETAEEAHRRRRLEQIHNARERFDKVRLSARRRLNSDSAKGRRRAREWTIYLALDVLRQLEPIIKRAEHDLLDVEVPVGGVQREVDGRLVTLPQKRVPLRDLLDGEGQVQVTETVERYDSASNTTTTQTETFDVAPRTEVSTRIVRLCDDFLHEVMPADVIPDDEEDGGIDPEDIR
jgi:hypothetical protein